MLQFSVGINPDDNLVADLLDFKSRRASTSSSDIRDIAAYIFKENMKNKITDQIRMQLAKNPLSGWIEVLKGNFNNEVEEYKSNAFFPELKKLINLNNIGNISR